MRYEIDENNYITAVYFNCFGSACAEYTGNIPDGYTSLEEWASNANIEAYKIVDSNLVYDSVRDEQLQAQWEEELQNNTPKEYELPTASATTLGGVKVGVGLSINEGVLSATGGGMADSVEWANVQNKPTNVSDFTNDAGYQTLKQVEATVTGKGYQTASDVTNLIPKTNIVTMYNSQTNAQEINVTATYTTYPIEFSSYNRVGDKFTVSNNKIVIGAGVTKVLVSGMLSVNRGKTSTMIYMQILKNSENIAYVATDFTDWAQVAMTANEALIDVQEGDTISMVFGTGYETGTYQIRKGLNMTRITVKAVE